MRRVVRAGSMTISLRESRREFYIPCTMTSNNTEWEWGWFYLRNDEPGLPLHRQGSEGEGGLLVARLVHAFALGSAGVSPARVEEPGARWAGCGFGPREPPPQADRSPHGEGAPHLRYERDGQPRVAGALAVGTRPLPPGSMRPRGRGAPSASRPSGIAMTTSGRSLCSPTPL
jgi:hypothetical protein